MCTYVFITMCDNIMTLFNPQEISIEVTVGDTIDTKVHKYPDWPQLTKILVLKKKVCLVKWFIEEEDGHFTNWTTDNGTEVMEEIKKKDVLFVVTLTDGYLRELDRIINSFIWMFVICDIIWNTLLIYTEDILCYYTYYYLYTITLYYNIIYTTDNISLFIFYYSIILQHLYHIIYVTAIL